MNEARDIRPKPQPVKPDVVGSHTPRDPIVDFFRRLFRRLRRN